MDILSHIFWSESLKITTFGNVQFRLHKNIFILPTPYNLKVSSMGVVSDVKFHTELCTVQYEHS